MLFCHLSLLPGRQSPVPSSEKTISVGWRSLLKKAPNAPAHLAISLTFLILRAEKVSSPGQGQTRHPRRPFAGIHSCVKLHSQGPRCLVSVSGRPFRNLSTSVLICRLFFPCCQLQTLDMDDYFQATADHILAQLFFKKQNEFKKIPTFKEDQAINLP